MFQIPAEGSEQILADSADDTEAAIQWSAGNSVIVQHVDMEREEIYCRIPETGNYVVVSLDGGLEGFEWVEED